MGAMTRLMKEEMSPLDRVARSRAESGEVFRVLTGPDRDRLLGVVDEQ